MRCGPSVREDDEWRALLRRAGHVPVRRRIEQRMSGSATLGGELDIAGLRHVARIDVEVQDAPKDLPAPVGRIDHDDARWLGTARTDEDQAGAVALQRGPVGGVGEVDVVDPSRGRVQDAQPRLVGEPMETGHASLGEERVRGHVEQPRRYPELLFPGRQGLDPAVDVAIDVPPSCSVGDEMQHALGTPVRLEDRLLGTSRYQPRLAHGPVLREIGHPQLAAVPWHVRVVPREPCQSPAVWGGPGVREKVVAGGQGPGLAGAVGWQGDELIQRFRTPVPLSNADEPTPVRRQPAVGVAVGPRGEGLRSDRTRLASGAQIEPVEALVSEVREEDGLAVDEKGPASVLVDPRPDVGALRCDVGGAAVIGRPHQHVPAAFGRPQLQPVHGAGLRMRFAHTDLAAGDPLGGDGRPPGTVGSDPWTLPLPHGHDSLGQEPAWPSRNPQMNSPHFGLTVQRTCTRLPLPCSYLWFSRGSESRSVGCCCSRSSTWGEPWSDVSSASAAAASARPRSPGAPRSTARGWAGLPPARSNEPFRPRSALAPGSLA